MGSEGADRGLRGKATRWNRWRNWLHRQRKAALGGRAGAPGSDGRGQRGKPRLRRWLGVGGLLASTAMLTAFVLWRIPRVPYGGNYAPVVLAWIGSIGLYALAMLLAQGSAARPRRDRRLARRWVEPLAVGVIVLGALLVRVWRIGDIPYTLAGDEASQGLEALRVIDGTLTNPLSTGWLSVPSMSFFYNSLTLRFMGATVTALRLPWALVGASAVLVVYFLVRRLQGPRLALATAGVLAAYHYHIHFSRLGSNQIADTLLAGLAVLLLVRALERGGWINWVYPGLVAGLAFYFYAGARFVPVVLLGILAYHLVRERSRFLRRQWRGLLVFLGMFLVAAAPMLQLAVRSPGDFDARLNQVGILQSGWLREEVGIRGESEVEILFDQFIRAVLAFNYYSDRTVWYGLRTPFLDPAFGSLFLLGLGYAMVVSFKRGGDKRYFPMVIWWWGAIILGGMMTVDPPSSMRIVTSSVPACFFVVLGLWLIIRLARQAFAALPVNVLLAAGVLLFALVSLKTYFVDFSPLRIYGGRHAELGTVTAPLFNELKADHDFYFVGPPWMYWGFATIPYLVPGAQGQDILEPITSPPSPDMLPPERGAVFVFLPERLDELSLVSETFPNGQVIDVHGGEGRMLGRLYIVSPT